MARFINKTLGATADAPAATRKQRAVRRVTVPSSEDLEMAREDALLQLKIGRNAHYFAVLVSAALGVDALLVLFLQPDLLTTVSARFASNFFLAFVIASGLYLAIAGLQIKWETYQVWPWESHFWVTILAVVLNATLAALYLLATLRVGPTQNLPLIPWFYPLALLGVGAPLAGMALTWSDWGNRKSMSFAFALLPVVFAFVLYIPASKQTVANGLAISLFASALLVQTSGSFLHLISSGTRSHEREVINSGQSRLFQLADEVRAKEETIRFREQRLVAREADVESAEASLNRKIEAQAHAKAQIEGIQREFKLLSDDLDRKQHEFARRAAETNTLAKTLEDRENSISLREQEQERAHAERIVREGQLNDHETDLKRQGLSLAAREQEFNHRVASIPEAEARLEARAQDLNNKTAELLRRESELRTRQGGGGSAASRAADGPRITNLEQREAQLNQLKMALDEQNIVLGRKAKQIEQDKQQMAARETELSKREISLTSRESGSGQKEKEAKERLATAEQRRTRYEEALKRYEERIGQLDKREAELSARGAELERSVRALEQREGTIKTREGQSADDRSALDRLQRSLIERQKEVEAHEEELAVRRQALARTAKSGLPPPITEKPGELRDAGQQADESLVAPTTKRFADRVSTGTPRLDDLLMGGMPPKGHVLLIGEPFVGKEIVLYAFAADGLRKGESAVLITCARGPDEIRQHMVDVLPSFAEFEKKGRVQWIDASRPAEEGAPAASSKGTVVVKGPDDHPGILSALVAAVKKAETNDGGKVRVGFLGLSAALSHADEKAGFTFLQNFVGILKPRSALAIYTVEGGTLTEAQIERLMSRMDGAIRFKQEQNKTYLSVAGIGDVATRDWIECRSTGRALIVGSFSLERIR